MLSIWPLLGDSPRKSRAMGAGGPPSARWASWVYGRFHFEHLVLAVGFSWQVSCGWHRDPTDATGLGRDG